MKSTLGLTALLALSSLVTAVQAAGGDPHWTYQGQHSGPAHWATLEPGFETCAKGRAQSPINIQAAVKAMRWYLIALMPLARLPFVRELLDNVQFQIIAFNLVRDIEEFVRGVFGIKKQGVKP